MAQRIAKKRPLEGVNLNAAARDLKDTQARYLLNFERGVNNNDGGTTGGNEGMLTPVVASRLLQVQQLVGSDYTVIGAEESRHTGETYVWAYHAGGLHTLYRINADLSATVVYQGRDLNLSDDPRHAIRGAFLFFNQGKKYLCWVDGQNWQGFLDVETSIATNSFRVPYFQLGEFSQEQYWQLPTRPPMHCIKGSWVEIDAADEAELSAQNRMVDKTWQFRYKWIYTDGRESEWSPLSTSYYVERANGQKEAMGLPRCIELTFSAGHPQVERIVLAYRNCNGNAYAESNPFDFEQFKVIDKYADCLAVDGGGELPFWERGIRADEPGLTYHEDTNDFTYTFCGEDECQPIDVKETNRTENPCPITSFAVAAIENRLALINNVVGYPQTDCNNDCFTVDLVEPAPQQACKLEFVEVKFSVLIHNLHRQVNQPVFTFGANAENGEQKHFGGLMYRNWSTPFDSPVPYKQSFPGAQAGFLGYVEGTDFHGITKQYRKRGTLQEIGPIVDFSDKGRRRDISKDLDDGIYFLQIGTIKVAKGTKGFVRLSGHGAAPTDAYKDSSTTVIGVMRRYLANGTPTLPNFGATWKINASNTELYQREIYFEATGDVDLTQTPFVVADLSCPAGDLTAGVAATAVTGYVRDGDGKTVPRALIERKGAGYDGLYGSDTSYDSRITDHNGFYFISWPMKDVAATVPTLGLKVYVEGAGGKTLGHESNLWAGGTFGSMPNATFERDVEIDKIADYDNSFYASLRLRVRDCRGAAMPGVAVAVEGHKAALTNGAGLATVILRHRAYALQAHTLRAVLMQGDTGFTLCGEGCDTTMPAYLVGVEASFAAEPVYDVVDGTGTPVVVTVDPFFDAGRGLKTGGRYGFAPIFHDATGRHTWVPDAPVYVDLPTVNQKGQFAFSEIHWSLSCPLNLPEWVRYMSIVRTTNVAFETSLQWVVDRVTFIDSGGKEMPEGAGDKIRLSIQSLIDHNLQNLSANTAYEWVDGDRISFLADEKGVLYSKSMGALNFLVESAVTIKVDDDDDSKDRTGYELIISYDNRLKDLKKGALIELTRPYACDTEQPFFELCDVIDVENGEPVLTSGVLSTFDTYQVRRTIKYDEEKHLFPFAFEHHSPSDYWGNRCDDRGRVFFKNKWAKQNHIGDSVYISDALLQNGNRNGLSTFRPESVKRFISAKRGDITRAFTLDRAIKMICEKGNFIAAHGDEFVRMTKAGLAVASAGDILAETGQGNSSFGLHYDDPQAALFTGTACVWADSVNNAIVIDQLDGARDLSGANIGGYLAQKFQYRTTYNRGKEGLARIRLVMGYDPTSDNAFLSFHAKGWQADDYVANHPDVALEKNETIGISLDDGSVFFFSFTPEHFAVLRNTTGGNVFFAFRKGLPWVHKEKGVKRFNEFFGTPVDQRLRLLVNNEPDKIKLFVAMQQQSLVKYYADDVRTVFTDTNSGQVFEMRSEIPPATIELRENYQKGAFLFNKLTPGVDTPLWNGEALRGEWALVSLVRDNTVNGNLTAMDNTKRTRYNELDSILFTYAHSEQSAFNS